MTVFLKQDNYWIEYIPKKNLIFVIVPGAGTYSNKNEYTRLKTHFNLVYFGERGSKYDRYPNNWYDNKLVSDRGDHLGGLSFEILKYITGTGDIPSAIICGSRGGQVTIGKVWYSIWRGPTIIINAGCLTTQTEIPIGVKPLFITMKHDYFTSVNSQSKVKSLFEKLNKNKAEKGIFIHLPNEAHMPIFKNNLKNLLLDCVMYLLNYTEKIENKSIEIS